jgi:hypothetical protein
MGSSSSCSTLLQCLLENRLSFPVCGAPASLQVVRSCWSALMCNWEIGFWLNPASSFLFGKWRHSRVDVVGSNRSRFFLMRFEQQRECGCSCCSAGLGPDGRGGGWNLGQGWGGAQIIRIVMGSIIPIRQRGEQNFSSKISLPPHPFFLFPFPVSLCLPPI